MQGIVVNSSKNLFVNIFTVVEAMKIGEEVWSGALCNQKMDCQLERILRKSLKRSRAKAYTVEFIENIRRGADIFLDTYAANTCVRLYSTGLKYPNDFFFFSHWVQPG